MYFISTLLLGFTTGPVPTLRSLMTSAFGGGPTCTGTAGAPFGNVPFVFTHGLPAADARVAAVVGAALSLALVVGGAVTSTLLSLFCTIATAPASAAPPMTTTRIP